jgi:ribosome-associated translation inhibitor RaiA
MQIHFKIAHGGVNGEDEAFSNATDIARRKIETLKKYLARTEETTQVYVELGKESEAHKHGNIWCAQINVDSRGKRYNARAVGETIEQAVGKTVAELEAELRKAKRRNQSMLRRSGNAMKLFIRGFKNKA